MCDRHPDVPAVSECCGAPKVRDDDRCAQCKENTGFECPECEDPHIPLASGETIIIHATDFAGVRCTLTIGSDGVHSFIDDCGNTYTITRQNPEAPHA